MQPVSSSGRHGARTRSAIAAALFLAIAGFLLFTEHRAHVLGLLPFALLLACPLVHAFHHGGHGGHQDGRPVEEQVSESRTEGDVS